MEIPKFIFFAGNNCIDYPKGGITSFSQQFISVFDNIAIVGSTTDDTPIGKWVIKEFNGKKYYFFSIDRQSPNVIKPFFPARLSSYLKLKKYKKKILSLNIKYAFVQNSHFLLAIKDWPFKNKAYFFHGVTNPLSSPRYKVGKYIATMYENLMFKRLKTYNAIFAAADDFDIKKLISRSNGKLSFNQIIKFPTRFDDTVFYSTRMTNAREKLDFDKDVNIFVQVGRISKQKGCDFVLDSFSKFHDRIPNSILIFIGDGEERENLQQLINNKKLTNNAFITGFKQKEEVALYYNAANTVLVGSHMEGWSVSMVEALACGKPIVSTNISGAKDMIIENKNGFIVSNRNSDLFAKKMLLSLELENARETSIELAKLYSISTMRQDIEKKWKPYE